MLTESIKMLVLLTFMIFIWGEVLVHFGPMIA
jgi:hypothetical protein